MRQQDQDANQIQTPNNYDHDSNHDNEDYSQSNLDDDHTDKDDLSLDDISQDELDQLNKDPNEVHSAASVQQNDNNDEAELTNEGKGPRQSSRESVPNVLMNISSMSG